MQRTPRGVLSGSAEGFVNHKKHILMPQLCQDLLPMDPQGLEPCTNGLTNPSQQPAGPTDNKSRRKQNAPDE